MPSKACFFFIIMVINNKQEQTWEGNCLVLGILRGGEKKTLKKRGDEKQPVRLWLLEFDPFITMNSCTHSNHNLQSFIIPDCSCGKRKLTL